MKFLYNEYANDGTELIIFYDSGTHVLKRYDGDGDLDGEIITTGTFDKCRQRLNHEWVAIAEALIG